MRSVQSQSNRPNNRDALPRNWRHNPANTNRGYFHPESVIHKIDQEALVLLGGGRSILLQLAHPFVAAGVDDHSNFQQEILDRLHRTLLFMQNLVFEERSRARKALQNFHAMHERIRGRLPHRAGRFQAGAPYSGKDPEAKLWVHATSVDTSLKVYERFVAPLTAEQRKHYYSDTLLLAQLMHVPEKLLPKTLDAFQDYMEDMLASDTLAVTPTAQRLANAVLYPQVGFFPAMSAALLRFVTAGILPERFRREYEMKWTQRCQFILNCLSRSTRTLRPVAPAWVWKNPLLGGKLSYSLLWGVTASRNSDR